MNALLRRLPKYYIKHFKLIERYFTMSAEGPYNFVNGCRSNPIDITHKIKVIEPATGKLLAEVPNSGSKEIDRAVECARKVFAQWSQLGGQARGRLLLATAAKIRENLESIAQLEVQDTGKPIWEARVDIAGCADIFEYYGGIASSVRGFHQSLANGNFAIIQREPLGVVAGIGAWNYPFQVMTWKVAPALACGNTFVYKPSQFTPLTSVLLAELMTEAGILPGCINIVQGEADTGEALCNHPLIAKLTFTGSVPTGQKIMKICSESVKRVTLEMGGKSALIVFSDCDITDAVKATLIGNFLTQGEVCSNCTRVFVERSILEPFLDKLKTATEKMVIGDPVDDSTEVGAVINKDHGQKILNYIEKAKEQGAEVICGGERIFFKNSKLSDGFYISPCVLKCTDNMSIVKEEVFGPVVSILPFDKEDEVVERANNSPFGLAGGVMTKDLQRAHRVASKLQAGIVWINNYNVFPPEVPFGGFKMSGFGKENGLEAINDFSQLKTIYVEANSNIDCPIYKL